MKTKFLKGGVFSLNFQDSDDDDDQDGTEEETEVIIPNLPSHQTTVHNLPSQITFPNKQTINQQPSSTNKAQGKFSPQIYTKGMPLSNFTNQIFLRRLYSFEKIRLQI